jgi:hypothetical protein
MVTYQAGKLVVEEEGFDDLLDETRDRVDEIEGTVSRFIAHVLGWMSWLGTYLHFLGLHRQSELTVKEPFKINVSAGSMWSWLWPGTTKTIEVEGLGASFIPAEKGDKNWREGELSDYPVLGKIER